MHRDQIAGTEGDPVTGDRCGPRPPFYRWKRKYEAMGVAEFRRLRQLEDENRKLKKLGGGLGAGQAHSPGGAAKKGRRGSGSLGGTGNQAPGHHGGQRPGKPVEKAYIESFNGKLREDCLSLHWFKTIEEAQEKIEAWRIDYNRHRPHSALNDQTPSEFVENFDLSRAVEKAGF